MKGSLTPAQRATVNALYAKITAALEEHQASTAVAFSALGEVLSQCVSGHPGMERALVDQFAKTAREIVDRKLPRP